MISDDADREALLRLRGEVDRLRAEVARLATPLEVLLRRRGFRVYKKEPAADLLLPGPQHLGAYYALLGKYSFRLFLRDAIRHQDRFTADLLARYATVRTIRSYIVFLLESGLAEETQDGCRLVRPVTSFGPTLEWYVARLLEREFGAEVLWGVKFRRPKVGGDYDVLGRLDGAVVYIEVKSSPPRQIYDSEVRAFLDRVGDLAPDLAIFLMDTELRMKDKLVPMFEQALAGRSAPPRAVERLERELFTVQDRLFIINAKESMAGNIGTVVARYIRKRGAQ